MNFRMKQKDLILEGPAWNPAVSNGEKIDDVVRLRIMFK